MRALPSALAACVALTFVASGCATSDGEDLPEDFGDEDGEIFAPEELEPKAAYPACGTVLSSFDGVAAYSNGANMGTGESCNGSHAHGLRYQCVELAMRFFNVKYGVARFRGHAKHLLANARGRAGLVVRANGDAANPPVPGDMLVWTSGTYGHVGIVSAVTATSVTMIEQNASRTGRVTMRYNGKYVSARPGGTARPAGWIHAVNNRRAGADQAAWRCADSAYQGRQVWTCNGTSLVRCEGGVPVTRACGHGCEVQPAGTDDTCRAPSAWRCEDSEHLGAQLWTCSGQARYRCTGGVPQVERCASGCEVNPLGTDDTCR